MNKKQLSNPVGNYTFVVYCNCIVGLFNKWGTNAELAIVMAFMFFTIFSGVNHARSIIQDKNYKWANLNRPFLAILLTAVLWYPVAGSF